VSTFLETLISGVLTGMMYSLVAISFILIFRASGVFNYAQGAMMLFSTLFFVTMLGEGAPFIVALLIAIITSVLLAVAVERVVLRPMANSSAVTLFMATLGVSYVVNGLAQGILGTETQGLDLGIEDTPIFVGGVLVSRFDLWAAGFSLCVVILLALFFSRTRLGISVRAVADDTAAAQSVGINLSRIWQVSWALSAVVGLFAGMIWGASQGVSFSLEFLILKALPVLIIGGFTSIEGAIVAGILVGGGEALAETYLSPYIGGGLGSWFAYVLAVAFLLIRPTGLFGDAAIERV